MSEFSSLRVAPVLLQSSSAQPFLFVEVFRDDNALLQSEDGHWLRSLRQLDWRPQRVLAAQYYQALWEFNREAARQRALAELGREPNPETFEEAVLRLVAERPTGGNERASRLVPVDDPPMVAPRINPDHLEPGVVPFRLMGKTPKCFFALAKAYLGVHLMGKAASAEEVRHHLLVSPPFVRACGFTVRQPDGKYRASDVPSLRKLEQFDQIMATRGLWSTMKIQVVTENLLRGVVSLKEQELTYDTTHFLAYSAMDVVPAPEVSTLADSAADMPAPAQRPSRRTNRSREACRGEKRARRRARAKALQRWTEERQRKKFKRRGKPAQPPAAESPATAAAALDLSKKKSQSRTVKECRCLDREVCPHPWVQSDVGAGTVVKGGRVGGKKKYWAHKAAVLSTGRSGVPLDATAMADAANHDSVGLLPQLERFYETYPVLHGKFRTLLSDTAMDDADLKESVWKLFGLSLKTPVNPRSIKPITVDLGRGMKSLSPTGALTCQADKEMQYVGVRFATEEFLYGPPPGDLGNSACGTCPLRKTCCRAGNHTGRHVAVNFIQLPHINPADPPMARRFKALMRNRTGVERAIKRLKLDFGDDRLTRRGNKPFQAHLDRSLIALHLSLRLDA